MAFTFDYTLQGSESNSFVPLDSYTLSHDNTDYTILGANDYFGGHYYYDKWNSLSDTQKQQLLVKATTRINMEQFGGRRANAQQALEWPRLWIIDRNYEQDQDFVEFTGGNYFQPEFMNPRQFDIAIFEMAMDLLMEYIEEDPNVSRQDQERLEEYSIGPLSYKPRKRKEHKLPDLVVRALQSIGPNAWLGWRAPKIVR